MRGPAVALAVCCLVTLWQAALTWAQDGATIAYEGTQEAGGPVRVTLAAEPDRVIDFEAEGVAGGGCSWDTITLANWGGELALVDGRFEATNPDGDTLTGALLGEVGTVERRLEGTIQVRDPARGCETPPLRWVAAPAAS
jgi:hypothetical protein